MMKVVLLISGKLYYHLEYAPHIISIQQRDVNNKSIQGRKLFAFFWVTNKAMKWKNGTKLFFSLQIAHGDILCFVRKCHKCRKDVCLWSDFMLSINNNYLIKFRLYEKKIAKDGGRKFFGVGQKLIHLCYFNLF